MKEDSQYREAAIRSDILKSDNLSFTLLPRKFGSEQIILAVLSLVISFPLTISFSASETLSGTAMQSAVLLKFVIIIFSSYIVIVKFLGNSLLFFEKHQKKVIYITYHIDFKYKLNKKGAVTK